MAMATAINSALYPEAPSAFKENDLIECIANELTRRKAITVEGDSVTFDPKYMKLGQFYLVELKNKPYWYRKVSDHEVEFYGLAEES